MKRINTIRTGLLALIMCLSLCGCGNDKTVENGDTSGSDTQQSEEVSNEEAVIDYGDAESFEAGLNEGKNLEGKVVRFVVKEFHPQSKLGYNVWAGEHLNFVSSGNPGIQEGDTMTVRVTKIENLLGSWIIDYEKVDNGVMGEDTITYSEPEETTAKVTEPVTEPATEKEPETEAPEEPAEEKAENTYDHNEYYDVVEEASFRNSIGYTTVIHKVLAKKNISVSGTVIAYGSDGSVIGKSSDSIVLTEGQYNYFSYSFENDVSSAKFSLSAQPKNDSFMTGERNAVEMVQYNKSGDDLYITFRQTGDSLEMFAKFKLLLYKGDTLVDTEEGYFNTYAKNLNGKDTTDVASVWVFGKDFDRVEYIFEP